MPCYVMPCHQAGWSGEKGTGAGPQRGRRVWERGKGRFHWSSSGHHFLSQVVFISILCRLPVNLMSFSSLSQIVFLSISGRLHLYLRFSSSLSHVVLISISDRLHLYLESSSCLSEVVFISISGRLHPYLRSSSCSCYWGRAGSPQGWSGGSLDSLNLGHQTDQEWTAKSGVVQLIDSLKFYQTNFPPYLTYGTRGTVRTLAPICSSLISTLFSEFILRQSHTAWQRQIYIKEYSVPF